MAIHAYHSSFIVGRFDENIAAFIINGVRRPINFTGAPWKRAENVENEPVANEDRWNNRCET